MWLCFSLISGVDASEQYLLDFQFPFMTDMYKLLPPAGGELLPVYYFSYLAVGFSIGSVLCVQFCLP